MFRKELPTGMVFIKTKKVAFKDTAAALGSGNAEVFATPALVALMEGTALELVRPFLAEGYVTVGTEVCIKHIKATPVGMQVTCKATLTSREGAKLTFEVEAEDEEGKIGFGSHKRFVVHLAGFMDKVKPGK